METLQNFPFFPVEFTKDGTLADSTQADALLAGLDSTQASDLLVLSHGWNNDMADARDLYQRFLGFVQPLLNDPLNPLGLAGRRFAVLGILWPSKKFADAELIPSGAASLDSPISDAMLTAELERLKGTFDSPDADARLTQAQALVPALANHESAQGEFVDLLRSVLQPSNQVDTDAADAFQSMDAQDLFARLTTPPPATALPQPITGDATPPEAGHASGIGSSLFGGIKAAAMNVLNLTTYYQMKNRAGIVGQGAANALLRRVRAAQPAVRLHLVGHSFGCRLLSAAVAGADSSSSVKVDSMTLLQGAFSHYGFSDNYDESGDAGFFRRVLGDHLVTGPLVVSHTRNDRAVGLLYPLASRLAGQVAQAIGDANDQYGGLGSNGAQKTPEATDGQLEDVGFAYAFSPDKVYNLQADAYISGHSDICHPQTAYAFLKAVATT
ncbi:MAG: hypothetical protein ACRYFX_18340 [Janthinobacterium lividum]